MILEGTLARVAVIDRSMSLDSLFVDLEEFARPKYDLGRLGNMAGDDNVLNMDEVKVALGTTDATVSALVKHRVLPTEIGINSHTRRPQAVIRQSCVDAFLESHRSLFKIASGWRRNIARMRDELDRNAVKPIFETSGKIARYYRTADLAEANLLPPNA